MSDPIDIVERLREALAADGDIPRTTSDMTQQQKVELAHRRASARLELETVCFNAAPVLLAEITRLRAALAAQVPQPVSVPEAPALDWPQMLMLINAYAGHVADAAQHQAASRADISHAAALKALTDIRMAMAAHTSRWQALVHELIWRASPPPAALAVPDGWALVPVAETKEMKVACLKATNGWWDSRAWPAMLAASPQAPADTQAQGPNVKSNRPA